MERQTAPRPTAKMLRFLEWERGVFLHFGIRTFNPERKDWDYVDMPIDSFNPTELDCRQWARTIKEAGFSYAVMTSKHHDGFCLWQTEHSDYSVGRCPWRDGKGDVVREYLEAMREFGIRTGLYYSPADQVIFNKKLSQDAHNELIRNHLLELCTNYGPIDYFWFDNCGSDKCVYDWDRVMTEVINPHQPDTIVNSNGDVESCWIGNEAGYAPRPCVYVHDLEEFGRERVSRRLLERVKDGKFWSPTEADCMLDAGSWFYRPERQLRSLDVLMGMYYYSVGRGINLLLNIGPDPRGLLPKPDSARLVEFGREIEKRFSNPIARIADMTRDEGRYQLELDEPGAVDHVVLSEDLSSGCMVRGYRIYAQPYLHAKEDIALCQGTGVGHKAVVRFPAIYLKKLVVEVVEPADGSRLKTIDVFGPADGE